MVDLDGFGGGVPSLYRGLPAEEVTRRRAEQLAMFTATAGSEQVTATQARELIGDARVAADAHGWDPDLEEADVRRCLAPSADVRYVRRPAPSALSALMASLNGWGTFAGHPGADRVPHRNVIRTQRGAARIAGPEPPRCTPPFYAQL